MISHELGLMSTPKISLLFPSLILKQLEIHKIAKQIKTTCPFYHWQGRCWRIWLFLQTVLSNAEHRDTQTSTPRPPTAALDSQKLSPWDRPPVTYSPE